MFFFIIILFVLSADQLSKYLVVSFLDLGQSVPILDRFFSITYVLNPGAALGLFAYKTIFFIVITVVVALIILYYYYHLPPYYKFTRIGLALQLGGAAGNPVSYTHLDVYKRQRIYNMVNDRQDWCISRQRIWGVPIPIFYCQSCAEPIINDQTIGAVQSLFAKEGSDAWFIYDAEQILPPGTVCGKCGKKEFRKEKDIMDVWFDSGSSLSLIHI